MSGTATDAGTGTGTAAADAAAAAAAAAATAAADAAKAEEGKAAEAKAATDKAAADKAAADAAGGKTTLTKTTADDQAKADDAAAGEIKYEIKAPEGIEIDTAAVDKFIAEVAKANKLTNEQAQAVVAFGAKHALEQAKAAEKATQEAIVAARDEEWTKLKADPEFGGKNWEKTQRDAASAFQKFASKEELAFIDTNMLGDRGPMITLFAKIHRAMSEGSTTGKGTNHADSGKITTEEDIHRQLYPSMFKDEEGSEN